MKKHNGFTLVELLISIGLSSLTISLIMSFMLINYRSFKYINDEAELQFQSQYILNFMSDKIMKSKNIEQIRNGVYSYLKKSDKQKVSKISFCYESYSAQCYSFEIRNYKIFYGDGLSSNNANIELGSYVKEMYLCPIPEGTMFENARAVKIILILNKGNQNYQSEMTVAMRNLLS